MDGNAARSWDEETTRRGVEHNIEQFGGPSSSMEVDLTSVHVNASLEDRAEGVEIL